MGFEPKKFSFILQRIVDRVVSRSELTDVVQGGAVWNVAAGTAREIDDVFFQMTNQQDIWDIDTATGDELDLRARDIPDGALVRDGALAAVTTLVFSRTGTVGVASIPVGTVARVPGGGPAFQTTVAGSIPDTLSQSAPITAVAVEAGIAGNVDADTITQLDGLAGVETVTNPVSAIGGQDEESDETFRERIKSYYRSLSSGVDTALIQAALSVSIAGFGRVASAQVQVNPAGAPCVVFLYIDDGLGTAETSANNYSAPDTLIAAAVGGEARFNTINVPVNEAFPFNLLINAVLQVRDVDYVLDPTTGLIILDEGVYPTGLAPADVVTASYTYYTGLIAGVQKVVNGDPADRVNFPGVKAAGITVYVLSPAVTQVAVIAVLTPDPEFSGSVEDLKVDVAAAISRYINGLAIGDDVILTEIVHKAQGVPGLRDITFTTPTSNIAIGVGELARVFDSNISLT